MKIVKTLAIIATCIAIFIGGALLMGCSSFGTLPAGTDLLRLEESPQYNKETAQFVNPDPGVLEALEDFSASFKDIYDFFFAKGERTPDDPLPQAVPAINDFAQSDRGAEFIWFGHSSLLLRISGKNILIDPVFSKRASPIPFTVGRFQKPALTLEELPEIDYIVISHDHYDHLDMETIKHFTKRSAEFIVPLGVSSHLRGWGIDQDRITELDWWQSTQRGELEFVATPARHFSGRGLMEKNKTLWASWVVRNSAQTIYFSGDSGYGNHFKQIGDEYGPFDLAFIETGQYNMKWHAVHMMPEEAAQAYFDLRAEAYVPIHWAMFELSMHTWYQPAMEINTLAAERGINLVTPMIGDIVNVESPAPTTPWWQPWVDPSRPREWYVQKVS